MSDEHARWQATGPYAVRAVHIAEWSSSADGPVAVWAQYPWRTDPAPVVVLAHGLGSSERGYAALGARLASHGYTVLHPQFLDPFPVVRGRLGMRLSDQHTWPRDPARRAAMHEMLFSPTHWAFRVARVHSVVDSLASQRHLPVTLRPDQVLIAGHSYGAYTAQLVLGARLTGVPVPTEAFRHDAVAAGVLLSPQGSGDRGLTPRSWEAVTAPLLVVTGSRDLGPHGEGLSWRREPFDAAHSRSRHLVVVRGGDHLLGGIDAIRANAADDGGTVHAIASVCAAFADLVHGDRPAAAWLASGPFPEALCHESREDLT